MKIRIIFAFISLLGVNAFCQTDNNVIKVQGNAIIYEVPELMVVNISVNAKDSIYEECSEKLVEYYNILEKAFVKNKVSKKDLKSDGLTISESYSWTGRERKKDGYTGNINVVLELPYNSEWLTVVMNTLKENDFPVTYNITFKLSRAQKENLLKKSIELAIEDAKTKAKYIAQSLNVTLAEIKDVNFGYTSYQNDLLSSETQAFYSIDQEMKNQDLSLNPQKMEIKKTLGIIWNIEQ